MFVFLAVKVYFTLLIIIVFSKVVIVLKLFISKSSCKIFHSNIVLFRNNIVLHFHRKSRCPSVQNIFGLYRRYSVTVCEFAMTVPISNRIQTSFTYIRIFKRSLLQIFFSDALRYTKITRRKFTFLPDGIHISHMRIFFRSETSQRD